MDRLYTRNTLGRAMMAAVLAVMVTLGLVMAPPAAKAGTIPVDLELALVVDVSGSVSNSEFNLQRQGYVDAFNDPAVIAAIMGNPVGAIAATLIYWSSDYQQATAVGWTYISDAASAQSFATSIGNTTRPFAGQTSISAALDYATQVFAMNDIYEGASKVIDISGDGTNNDDKYGRNLALARADTLAAGIIINGLPIGDKSLYNYYSDNVIGGDGSFAIRAKSFSDFTDSLKQKLVREVTDAGERTPTAGTPEPATAMLLASAMGLGAVVRRRRSRKADA